MFTMTSHLVVAPGFILTWHVCILCCHKYHLSNWIHPYRRPHCPRPNTWAFLLSISSLVIPWALYFWVIFIHHYCNSLAVSLLLFSVFLLLFLSHLNSTRTAPSPLSSTQFIYHATLHAFTNIHVHTHSYAQAQPSPTRTGYHAHTNTHTQGFSGSGAWQEQVTAP